MWYLVYTLLKMESLVLLLKGMMSKRIGGLFVKSLNIVTDAPAPAPALAPSEEETHTSS